MGIQSFSKMHGLGNDFIVLNALHEPFDWSAAHIRELADRYTGIGFDQLLVVEPPPSPDTDFAYRIFNADGSEVEHCGNGARCFGKYIRDHNLCPTKNQYRVAIKKGIIDIAYAGEKDGIDQFRVNMGEPDFTPFTTEQCDRLHQPISVNEHNCSFGIVSMGNPHAVTACHDITNAAVTPIGSALQKHPLFPAQVNVGFMQIIHRGAIALRVFERGVGETQACGTGACAAAAVGIARGDLDQSVAVKMHRGELIIEWCGEGHDLFMTGPAETVYHGTLA
ncbi:diaminopimelate epimerase [Cardiobacteriaceae bacterium TAE3-ERU3]|nr:diaminopimelate epimerase [Cardiobacteriaceae bacterium TAE3-ERU3]